MLTTIENVILIIVGVFLALRLLVELVKGTAVSEGYKLKELEIKEKQLTIELEKERQHTTYLITKAEDYRTQRSNLMLEILCNTLYSDQSPKEIIETMKHNYDVMYKTEGKQ